MTIQNLKQDLVEDLADSCCLNYKTVSARCVQTNAGTYIIVDVDGVVKTTAFDIDDDIIESKLANVFHRYIRKQDNLEWLD